MVKKNKGNTRIIVLGVLLVLIVIVLALGVSYAYLAPVIGEGDSVDVTITSCINLEFSGSNTINLTNTYPMSRNRGLQTTPYTFTISKGSCEGDIGYYLYIGVLSTTTLDVSGVHYILTETGTTTVIAEGLVGDLTTVTLSESETTEFETTSGGSLSQAYQLYSETLDDTVTYDLYLFIDDSVEYDTVTYGFYAGIAAVSYGV